MQAHYYFVGYAMMLTWPQTESRRVVNYAVSLARTQIQEAWQGVGGWMN